MFNRIMLIAMLVLLPMVAFGYPSDAGKPVKVVTDADIDGVTVFSRDTVYNLHGLVFVENNEVLVIEPGTIVKGDTGEAENSTALIVARGGQIYAVGTPCEPIIFTTILDNVDDVYDIPLDGSGRGLWGGILILGTSTINDPSGWGAVEGILPSETRGRYGVGDGLGFDVADPADNSGVLRYVSVRHGGTNIGEANEINGITLAAVGYGTEIDYVEAFMNDDDGFEWFGGTVRCNHLVAAMCNDDSFDYDEGFNGGGQFWFTVQTGYDGDSGGEHDGGGQQSGTPEDVFPWATPTISNVTYVGPHHSRLLDLKDNAGGTYYNSIFANARSQAVRVEFNNSFTSDAFQKMLREQLKLYNNVWHMSNGAYAPIINADVTTGSGNNPGNALAAGASVDSWIEYILFRSFNENVLASQLRGTIPGNYPVASHVNQTWNNFVTASNPIIAMPGYDVDGVPLQNNALDPRPANIGTAALMDNASAHWTTWVNPCDANLGYDPNLYDGESAANFPLPKSCDFEAVNYVGAFDPNAAPWIAGWTALAQYQILADFETPDYVCATTDAGKPEVIINDADITGFTHFSANNVYVLNELVFVEAGEVLYIEPGTVIKGDTGEAENSKALIVARDGKAIMAGAECAPIIFTTTLDDVSVTDDIPFDGTGRGLWGGIIILGKAPINDPAGWGAIEGILPSETRGRYGVGDGIVAGPADVNDNSGIYRYVSVRHGGTNIGEANEINGWTFGAVGAGTAVDHLEALYNDDDGYEWFGGTVRCNYLVTAFCNDDSFDYDEGYRGGGQFWFTVQTNFDGDSGGEHDGGGQQSGTPEDVTPWGTPLISNVTYIGPHHSRLLDLKDNTGGAYYNSVFANARSQAIRVEFNNSFTSDAYQKLLREQLKLYNNVWGGSTVPGLAPIINANGSTGSGNNPGGYQTAVPSAATDSWVEGMVWHTFNQADFHGQLRGTIPAVYPVAGHESQNWRNYVSDVCVFNSLPNYDMDGAPIPDGMLDPRVANLGCAKLLDSANATWSGWVNPCDPFLGYDPSTYDAEGAVSWPDPQSCDFVAVNYPGAFDPNVPMSQSWITWTGTYCYGFVGDNPCTETCGGGCCTGVRGNVDNDPDDIVSLGDLTALIDILFISLGEPTCFEEADVDGQPPISLGDLTALIDVLFISLNDPLPCP